MLALATVIPMTGWAGDRFGTKRLWMTAVALFVAGSILCGLAWSITSLIVFRVLQGLGGGMIMPAGQALLARAAGPQRMGRVMSVVGVPMLLGPILGPVLGGVIVDSLDWRWIFFVNVPVGALALLLAARLLPASRPNREERLDVRGLLLLSPGLGLFVWGLAETGAHGGLTRASAGALAGGLGLIACFVLHALGRGRSALIDVSLFRARAFSAAAVTGLLFGASIFGTMILLPLYYQVVRGEGALAAGLLLAPQGIGAAIALPIAGWLTDRFGAGRVVPVGLALAIAGTAVYTQLAADTSYAVLAGALVIRGIGLGATMMPAMAAAYQTLERSAISRATATLNVIQRVGGSIGTALLAVLLARNIHESLPSLPSSGLGGIETVPPDARERAAPLLAEAFAHTFWVALVVTALAFVPALLLPRRAPARLEPLAVEP
jgi:EmrB/QacA subfamily drug resistance transporter